MANHPDRANNYVISKTWDEVMAGAGAKGDAEAHFLPLMQKATSKPTAVHGEAAGNGGGMEPFNYTTEGRPDARPPEARKRRKSTTKGGC